MKQSDLFEYFLRDRLSQKQCFQAFRESEMASDSFQIKHSLVIINLSILIRFQLYFQKFLTVNSTSTVE
jgi:hypothetical protein